MLYKLKNITKDIIDLHGRKIHPKEEIKTATIEPYRLMIEQGFLKIISEDDDGKASVLYVHSKRKGEAFSKPFMKMNKDINNYLNKRLKQQSKHLDKPISTDTDIKIKPLEYKANLENDNTIYNTDLIPNITYSIDSYDDIKSVTNDTNTSNDALSNNITFNDEFIDTISNNSFSIDSLNNFSDNLSNDTISLNDELFNNNEQNNIFDNDPLDNLSNNDLLNNNSSQLKELIIQPVKRKDISLDQENSKEYQIAKASMRQINKSLFPSKKNHGADEAAQRLNKTSDELLEQFNKISQETNNSLNNNLQVSANETKKIFKISELKLMPKKNSNEPINSLENNKSEESSFKQTLNEILDITNKFVYRGYVSEDKFDEIMHNIQVKNNLSTDSSNISSTNTQSINTELENINNSETALIESDNKSINQSENLSKEVVNYINIEELTNNFSSILDKKLETITQSLQNISHDNIQVKESLPIEKDKIIQSLFHLFIDHNISSEDLSNIKNFYKQTHILDNIDNNIKKQIQDASSYEDLITVLLNNVYPSLF